MNFSYFDPQLFAPQPPSDFFASAFAAPQLFAPQLPLAFSDFALALFPHLFAPQLPDDCAQPESMTLPANAVPKTKEATFLLSLFMVYPLCTL
jgi:hypothetical protein